MNRSYKLFIVLLAASLVLTGCGLKVSKIFNKEKEEKIEQVDKYEQYKDSNSKFVTINEEILFTMFETDHMKALNEKENEVIEKMKEYGYEPISVTSSKVPNNDRSYLYTILFQKVKD